jgi:hypothetical protein
MSASGQAEALMRAALPLMASGDWTNAAASLEQAAALHAAQRRAEDQARCLQLAAMLRRAVGEPEAAQLLVARAAVAAPDTLPLSVAILAERAMSAASQGKQKDAAALFGESLQKAREAGLNADAQIALLRGRMAAHTAFGALAAAEADVAAACALADARIGGFLRVEQARLLLDAGHAAKAARALPSEDLGDVQLRAEILVQRARLARGAGDIAAAGTHAAAAHDAALAAVAPVPYFAASVELAEAFDAQSDRLAAYTALAAAWGTLSDLLGRDVARSWVEPCLLALRLRWGDADFANVKAAHDAHRHAEQDRRAQ